MRKIRLLEFSMQRCLGGTDKDSQIAMKYYDRDKFDVFAASWVGGPRAVWIDQQKIPNFICKEHDKMTEWIKSQKIDIVHVYRAGTPDQPLIDTFKNAGVPIIIERNAFAWFDETYDTYRINKHIVCSNTSKEIYKKRAGIQYQEDKVEIIYCPTDLERFDNFKFDRDWNSPVFGRYSRKDKLKWHPINIQILPIIRKAIPESRFLVIGMPDEYRNLAKSLGVYDMITEFDSPDDDAEILNFLNKITVFTHGSVLGESFGNILAESMCAGIPIVTHFGGDSAQSEVVTDGFNGYCVDSNNINEYADKVIELLKNPEKKKEMGENGKKRAYENYDAKKIIKQFEDVFIKEFNKLEGQI